MYSNLVKKNILKIQYKDQLVVKLKVVKYIKSFFSFLSFYIIYQTFSIIYI